ncbi:aspartyl-phosphate phosphatase Spo0E family protein [Bacillus cytotoxicus]|uniref:Aspartyl-phosphate phosphatase Spo0E family protein n=2 Tax=Bacillus cytotoxicus TaxID=580165 RepID=A0AAX2CDQ7_9BACI|nr:MULTISPECIES: aspartyl-phosphate phosphatase Spo0E family protein [Bacillus cereus group]ABS21202.1 putative stage 0 sporulation regulatory protein [Bacillus cytotoxicus NVH 391-98]AWC27848.1 aspartyl-phosphate phosphatase Spo0E family protein [Bacillus cytotoxicus]AWC31894.1 aspartyl-phosphate phosphatase Spo0E family protein [Bacillus cytotoxicus]AWC35931.1 aspartyl-phosphate phosphatase Spo0E family protein [Bacillus cytotoxicus]AWC40771.1 aspartyl-phosphate phosphatase Spo0E family prot
MFEQVIEKKRKKMIYFAERYGITSQKTVNCSQELDKLLNIISLIQTNTTAIHTIDRHTH